MTRTSPLVSSTTVISGAAAIQRNNIARLKLSLWGWGRGAGSSNGSLQIRQSCDTQSTIRPNIIKSLIHLTRSMSAPVTPQPDWPPLTLTVNTTAATLLWGFLGATKPSRNHATLTSQAIALGIGKGHASTKLNLSSTLVPSST